MLLQERPVMLLQERPVMLPQELLPRLLQERPVMLLQERPVMVGPTFLFLARRSTCPPRPRPKQIIKRTFGSCM